MRARLTDQTARSDLLNTVFRICGNVFWVAWQNSWANSLLYTLSSSGEGADLAKIVGYRECRRRAYVDVFTAYLGRIWSLDLTILTSTLVISNLPPRKQQALGG